MKAIGRESFKYTCKICRTERKNYNKCEIVGQYLFSFLSVIEMNFAITLYVDLCNYVWAMAE